METAYPYDEAAEESIIGAVIINPDCYYGLGLEASHFYVHKNRVIWEAIQGLINNKVEIDYVSIADKLMESHTLGKAGGPARLAVLVNRVPSSQHAEAYAGILKKMRYRRIILETASELAGVAGSADGNLDTLSEKVLATMNKLYRKESGTDGIHHVQDIIKTVYEQVEEAAANPRSIWGMATGFDDFDVLTGGIHKGDLMYFIGSPGAGKSILTLNLAMGLLSNKYPGVLYSFEMSNTSQILRAISAKGEIATRRLKTGKMDEETWIGFTLACEALASTELYITDQIMTLAELHSSINRMKQTRDIQWVIVDYLWLIRGYESKSETERSSVISSELKRIIKTEQVAGLVINAVTKNEYYNALSEPSLSDMRGSSMVAHDADVVAHVKRLENENILRLYFTKMRDIGKVEGREVDLLINDNHPKLYNSLKGVIHHS